MPWYITHQDYLSFVDGGASLLLGLVALLAARESAKDQPFWWLGVFGVTRGLPAWAAIPLSLFAPASWPNAAITAGSLLSSLSLLECARTLSTGRNPRTPGPWLHLPALALMAAAALVGGHSAEPWLPHLFAVPAALWAGWELVHVGDTTGPLRRTRRTIGTALAGFAAAAALAQLANRGATPGPLAIVVRALSVALLSAAGIATVYRTDLLLGIAPKRARGTVLAVVTSAAALVVCGLLLTDSFGLVAESSIRTEARSDAATSVATIEAHVEQADGLARLLATNPEIVSQLVSGARAVSDPVNDTLDRYSQTWAGAACFLVNMAGQVVASSDRYLPGSLIGNSVPSDSFFQDAVVREQGRYFGIGATAAERCYYAARAVRSPAGTVAGAVVVRRVEDRAQWVPESARPTFLIDVHGIVFLGSRPDLDLRALWPLSPEAGSSEPLRRQFGAIDTRPLLPEKAKDGALTTFEGKAMLAARAYTGVQGWSLVSLQDTRQIGIGRLLGILATAVLVSVFLAFLAYRVQRAGAAARIEASEASYRAVVDGSPLWIALLDPEGRILLSNGHGVAALGLETPPPPGAAYGDLWLEPARARVVETIERARQEARSVSVELHCPSSGGGSTVWRLTVVPLAGRPGVVAVAADMTDQRRAEQSTLITERLAGVGTLAAGVAHQFNNINTGVSGYLQLALAVGDLPPRVRSYLEAASGQVDRATRVTGRLLEFARPRAAGPSSFLLGDLVREVAAIMEEMVAGEGITLTTDLCDTVPVYADAERLKFVIVSLVSNARHAVTGCERKGVGIRTSSSGETAVFEVKDTGAGIAEEALPSLFVPFFTMKGEWASPSSGMAGVKGMGLSLSVCHTIVSGFGGSISVDSRPGQGATFTVMLPAQSRA